jgi:hypothetical protein
LIDEYRLMIYSLVLGTRKRFFRDGRGGRPRQNVCNAAVPLEDLELDRFYEIHAQRDPVPDENLEEDPRRGFVSLKCSAALFPPQTLSPRSP